MRVRDDDCGEAAESLDALDGFVVDVRDAVPEDVVLLFLLDLPAVAAANIVIVAIETEKGALSDGKLWHSIDADQPGEVFLRDELVMVLLRRLELAQCRPLLAVRSAVEAVGRGCQKQSLVTARRYK